jgi:hypothetical protein
LIAQPAGLENKQGGKAMNKIKFNGQLTMKVLFVLAYGALVFLWPYWSSDLRAETYRPPNPVMDYVPQNIGITDKPYRDFTEPECRECHGSITAERHHLTEPAMMGKCLYSQGGCHAAIPPPPLVRDCQMCHTSDPNVYPEFYAVWGDLGNPHHKTDLADTGQCNQCHDPNLVVEAYSVPPPTYAPGLNTPTPASCENCHFWDDSVNPTIHGIGHIETWGPTGSGMNPLKLALGFDPDHLPSMGTHEEINGMIYSQCALCHWSEPGNQWDTNPYNPLSIRFCENCHTIEQLHANPEHVNTNNIYTVNGVPNQEVTGSAKCMACHGGVEQTPVIEKILGIKEPGLIIRIIGTNFGNTQGDSVVHIGPKTFNSSSPRIKLWSDTKVKIRLPNYQCEWFKDPHFRYIKTWVTVDGIDSNKKRLKVMKPSTCSSDGSCTSCHS